MLFRKIKIFLLLLTIGLTSCSEDSFFDFVLGEQPTFISDHSFVPGLNIFGVLRPDSTDSVTNSFVHIEKAIPAISDEIDTAAITDASVVVYKIENNLAVDSTTFIYNNHNNHYKLPEYRPNTFRAVAGERYKIICRYKDLPELISETIIPSVPKLEADTVIKSGNILSFTILKDTSASLYDINLMADNEEISTRVVRSVNGNTNVEINIPGKVNLLTIYAYDIKMASYFAVSNLSFKPNTYRPPFTNVQGGYGSFGSMNIYRKKLSVGN